MLTRFLCVPLLLSLLAGQYQFAQTENFAVRSAANGSRSMPFVAGETLVYDVTFSKLFLSGTIGSLTLRVANSDSDGRPGALEFHAEGTSKGFFTWLFKIKVNDKYVSIISPDDLGLRSSSQSIQEGKTRREQRMTIDREAGRATYSVKNLAQKPSEKITSADSPRWVQDLLSAVYYIRSLPLKEGDRIALPIVEAAKLYKIDVVVGRKIETVIGKNKYDTVELDVKAFDGNYIKRSGQLSVWVTDDPFHTPVKARIRTSGYTVNIDLVRSSKPA